MSWPILDELQNIVTDQQVVLSCMHISHLEHRSHVSRAAYASTVMLMNNELEFGFI